MAVNGTPKKTIERLKTQVPTRCPEPELECFRGYGVMGLTFESGHVLALRQWEESSIGPAYTSVWHRDPTGRWAFWSTEPPEMSCNRYTGASVDETRRTAIEVVWTTEEQLRVAAPELDFEWEVGLAATAATRLMSFVSQKLPWKVRMHPSFLKAMGPLGGRMLGVGRFNMTGRMPNGQVFIAAPQAMWIVQQSRARLGDLDLGHLGPLPKQVGVGDFLMPQRGVLAVGSAYFEPLDAARHLTVLSKSS